MKTSLVAALFLSSVVVGYGQTINSTRGNLPADTVYQIISQGANHRVWQRETYERASDGSIIPHIHKYTELASGLNYKDADGQWQESKEEIESYPGGAIVRHGQYQVIFANNLNSYGAIDMQTPDGKRLRSNILGLMYHDTATDKAVLIAQLKNSEGELVSSNQVLYSDAFDGVKADVRYTYRKGSFEQDVILREQPPAPETYGLNPDTTEIEVMTEFVDSPEAKVTSRGNNSDEEVSWGAVRLGHGKAFDLDAAKKNSFNTLVDKKYVNVKGQNILLEKVKLLQVEASISKLPLQSSSALRNKPAHLMAENYIIPDLPPVRKSQNAMQFAKKTPANQGYVLDYVQLSSSLTNYTFQGDTTYYISGGVNLYGTTTFEGGTVIKYAATSTASVLSQYGSPIKWDASPYRPVCLTAVDDNTVGETISGSTGTPTGYYGGQCLYLDLDSATNSGLVLQDLRMSYLNWSLGFYDYCPSVIRDAQFINCQSAIGSRSEPCRIGNVLVQGGANAFFGSFNATCENVTFHNVTNLLQTYASVSGNFTNNLFVMVDTNRATISGIDNVFLSSDMGVFQTIGAGAHYLAADSPYRNAGTTNIDPAVLTDIATKTTYPPVAYTNVTLNGDTVWTPQVQRDTDVPDLGYHYDPIDYAVGGVSLASGVTLTLSNGVAVAVNNTAMYGIKVLNNSNKLVSVGTPLAHNHLFVYNSVQEQPVYWGSQSLDTMIRELYANEFMARFTDFSQLGANGRPYYLMYADTALLDIKDCEMGSGIWECYVFDGSEYTNQIENNLFDRTSFEITEDDGYSPLTFRNNLVRGGDLSLVKYDTNSWVVSDNVFDSCALYAGTHGPSGFTNLCNVFINTAQITPTNVTDIVLTNMDYQTGPLGSFYLPSDSPLIDAGSTTADQVGLYHFTTQTNQVKETNSVVDIGYHYVAVDTNGVPFDTNGNGVPDYLDDANGNGSVDSSEIGWDIMNDLGLKVIISRPRNGGIYP